MRCNIWREERKEKEKERDCRKKKKERIGKEH